MAWKDSIASQIAIINTLQPKVIRTSSNNVATGDLLRIDNNIASTEWYGSSYPLDPLEGFGWGNNGKYLFNMGGNKYISIAGSRATLFELDANDKPQYLDHVLMHTALSASDARDQMIKYNSNTLVFVSLQGNIQIITFSGNTLSIGTEVSFDQGEIVFRTTRVSVDKNSGALAIIWSEGSGSGNLLLKATGVTISGTTPTVGLAVILSAVYVRSGYQYIALGSVNNSKFVSIHNGGGSNQNVFVSFSVTGTVVTKLVENQPIAGGVSEYFCLEYPINGDKFVTQQRQSGVTTSYTVEIDGSDTPTPQGYSSGGYNLGSNNPKFMGYDYTDGTFSYFQTMNESATEVSLISINLTTGQFGNPKVQGIDLNGGNVNYMISCPISDRKSLLILNNPRLDYSSYRVMEYDATNNFLIEQEFNGISSTNDGDDGNGDRVIGVLEV